SFNIISFPKFIVEMIMYPQSSLGIGRYPPLYRAFKRKL
ncbi:MAG: hypothetical protein ACI8RA_002490, partial [Chlamydiales bacterium]